MSKPAAEFRFTFSPGLSAFGGTSIKMCVFFPCCPLAASVGGGCGDGGGGGGVSESENTRKIKAADRKSLLNLH